MSEKNNRGRTRETMYRGRISGALGWEVTEWCESLAEVQKVIKKHNNDNYAGKGVIQIMEKLVLVKGNSSGIVMLDGVENENNN